MKIALFTILPTKWHVGSNDIPSLTPRAPLWQLWLPAFTLYMKKSHTFIPEDPNHIFKVGLRSLWFPWQQNYFANLTEIIQIPSRLGAFELVGQSLDFIKRTRLVLKTIFRESITAPRESWRAFASYDSCFEIHRILLPIRLKFVLPLWQWCPHITTL